MIIVSFRTFLVVLLAYSSLTFSSDKLVFPLLKDQAFCIVNYERNATAFQIDETGSFSFKCTNDGDKFIKFTIDKHKSLSELENAQLRLLYEMVRKQEFKIDYCSVGNSQKDNFLCVFHK